MKLLPKINSTIFSLQVLYGSFMIALVVLIGAVLAYQQNSLENVIQAEQKRALGVVKNLINDKVMSYTYDLKHLSGQEQIYSFLEEQNEESLSAIQNEFIHLANSNQNIEQLRLIDFEGNEQINVVSRNEIISIVPEEKLQNKKDRYYFRETMRLDEGMIYISKLDLNIEFGFVELPQRPTLRVSTPVFKNGERVGMLIINFNGREILDAIASIEGNGTSFYLANEDGFWLKYKDSSSEWSFMYDGDHSTKTMAATTPEAWKQVKNNTFNISTFTDEGIFITNSALTDFPDSIIPAEKWFIVSFVTNEIYNNYIVYIKTLIILVVIFISIAISFLFYNLIQLLRENQDLKLNREKYMRTQHKHLEVLTSTIHTTLSSIEETIKKLHENNIINEWTETIKKDVTYGKNFAIKTKNYSLHQTIEEENLKEISLRNFFREHISSYSKNFRIEGDALINSTLAIETALIHVISYLFIYAKAETTTVSIQQTKQGIDIHISAKTKNLDPELRNTEMHPKELAFAKSIIEGEQGEMLVSHSPQHIAVKIRIGGI